jgi:hypothetical protein
LICKQIRKAFSLLSPKAQPKKLLLVCAIVYGNFSEFEIEVVKLLLKRGAKGRQNKQKGIKFTSFDTKLFCHVNFDV